MIAPEQADKQVDERAIDPNRYYGDDEPDPFDGDVGGFVFLYGVHAWTYAGQQNFRTKAEPCEVCGSNRGVPTLRRSRNRRGLVYCLACDSASTDGQVDYHGEAVGLRYNEGWDPATTATEEEPATPAKPVPKKLPIGRVARKAFRTVLPVLPCPTG